MTMKTVLSVVTNNCNLLVGGARSFGWFTKTGGYYRQGNSGYPVMVGAAGGAGECLLGGGKTEILSHVFVGGVFTNAIPIGATTTNWLARYGWPVDNHTAVGTLTVTGGTVTIGTETTPRTVGVGDYGTGETYRSKRYLVKPTGGVEGDFASVAVSLAGAREKDAVVKCDASGVYASIPCGAIIMVR